MLNKPNHDWARYWYKRGASIRMTDRGFPAPPATDDTQRYNPNPELVPFSVLDEVPCLVLLGDQGLGKSRALRAEHERLRLTPEGSADKSLWKDLAIYSTDYGLRQGVSHDPEFTTWEQGTHTLHLFLDSFDESRAHIRTVPRLLAEWLGQYDLKRLRLRIVCRPAEWSPDLEDRLNGLWGAENVSVYVLAPLCRQDVEIAARDYEIDSSSFLAAIDDREVSAFAMRPVTLKMLISIFRANQQLPARQADLYYQGCLQLCQEEDREREQRVPQTLEVVQRFAIAARIAYLTVFTNRYAVRTSMRLDEVPAELSDVGWYDLDGRWERYEDVDFRVQEKHIEEVLGTGLFTPVGQGRIGWAHRSYAEYLAGWYLNEHNASVSQIMELLTNPKDPAGRIIPQLHDVAARLAVLAPGVFQAIMRVDPDVLLRSDVASTDAEVRAALVEALLANFESGDVPWSHSGYQYYDKLTHPGIALQLRAYITDPAHNERTRIEAINIAERCVVTDLEEDLVRLALDSTQPHLLRTEAAAAVARIGSAAARSRLRPLALGEAGVDQQDELQGWGLRACWPDYLSAGELFSVLHPPQNPDFFGSYSSFLVSDFAEHLSVTNIPAAMRWVRRLPATRGMVLIKLEHAIDGIIKRALQHLDDSQVRSSVARFVLEKLRSYELDIDLTTLLADNEPGRKALQLTLLRLLGEVGSHRRYRRGMRPGARLRLSARARYRKDVSDPWLLHANGIILPIDSEYLVERFKSARSASFRKLLATLLVSLVRRGDRSQLDDIYYVIHPPVGEGSGEGSAVMRSAFSSLLEPRLIASPQAQQEKEYYYESIRRREARAARVREAEEEQVDPPPAEQISRELEIIEAREPEAWLDAWWRLNIALALEPDSPFYDDLESDLTRLPGWKAADDETHVRIVQAAREYVLEGNPYNELWLGIDGAPMYHPALAGYRALRLLHKEDPGFLGIVPPAAWGRWAGIILSYPVVSEGEEAEVKTALACMAYSQAGEAVRDAFRTLARQENRQRDYISVVRYLSDCWDESLADVALELVGSVEMTPNSFTTLLDQLLAHPHRLVEATALAESFITNPPPADGDNLEKALHAGLQLMEHVEGAGWSRIWPAVQASDDFGHRLIERVAGPIRHSNKDALRLSPRELAELYLWLFNHYPPSPDDQQSGFVTLRRSIAYFRDDLLSRMERLGSAKAVAALEHLRDTLPEQEHLRYSVYRALEAFRGQNWQPLSPAQLLELALEPDARVVLTERHLQQVVMESLQRMNEDLQGETPTAIRLWNECVWHPKAAGGGGCRICGHEGSRFTPKDEERLSDEVKRHLEHDLKRRGIIINREVVIRRSDRTDLYISTFIEERGERRDQITVIVEVKGCWHDEVKTAMQTQLVDRYLRDHACRHGIYLVGWFLCNQWAEEGRKTECRRAASSMEGLEQILKSQAAGLSGKDLHIEAFVLNVTLRPRHNAALNE